MRNVVMIIILTLIAYVPLNVYGQNEYARQMEIMTEANSLTSKNQLREALIFIQDNESIFLQDEITRFWYDWLNGVLLYRLSDYSEARLYILSSISFLDKYQNELSDANMNNYLPVYYFLSDIDFRLGKHRNVLIDELEHAKYIYELVNVTTDQVYSQICSDLKALENNGVGIATDAINSFLAGDYQIAIPKLYNVIEYAKTNRPNEYVQLVNWMKMLAMAYSNIGDYNNAEKYYLSSLDILETHGLQKEKVYRLVLDAISVLYVSVQNYEKANKYNSTAKLLFEEAFDLGDDYVRCLSNSALIQHSLGQ